LKIKKEDFDYLKLVCEIFNGEIVSIKDKGGKHVGHCGVYENITKIKDTGNKSVA